MNAITLVRQTTVLAAGLFVLAIGHVFSCPFAGAQEFPPTERTEVGTKWKVNGKVTTARSRPISGVKVYVSRGAFYTPMSSKGYSDLQNPVTSSFSGKFEIDVQERHRLVFLKSGFALRNDGMFKMQGLPAGSKLHWSLDATRVKTRDSHGGIEIDASQLVNGETLTAEPIVCEDYTVLAGDLPEIEIGGLSNEAALEILTAYIEDSIERIPESGKKPSGGSSGEPVPTYMQKVIAKAIPIIKELADREPGSDFELELLTKIPPHLLSGGHASLPRFA